MLKLGFGFGAIGVYLAVIGLLQVLQERWVIADLLALGYVTLAVLAATAGNLAAKQAHRADRHWAVPLAHAAGAGLLVGLSMAALAIVARYGDLRSIFIALSPALVRTLSFELSFWPGIALLPAFGALAGLIGGAIRVCPEWLRVPILAGMSVAAAAGVFQDLVKPLVMPAANALNLQTVFYDWKGMQVGGALLFFVLGLLATLVIRYLRGPAGPDYLAQLTPQARRRVRYLGWALCLLGLLVFPTIAGPYVAQVFMLVGLYLLMGLGLNLELGVAGLLDLGFVAFFAVGAYTTALLTAADPHSFAALWGVPSLSYWAAMPIAVLLSVLVGMAFGIPVLGVRGDYLAVATLGLGEIVRVIVISDMAAPLLNGAGGILRVPRPAFGDMVMNSPIAMFYLTIFFSLIAAYCAWRLQVSRLGRAWTALKDDEDVARGLGINTVTTKLLAYGFGAAFAGLAGSILAIMLGSVFPSSFTLLVSINVLVLIVVGGLGSLMGVVIGALLLIGLPELLKEFGEYRFLLYGVALILVMVKRPEGIWPAPIMVRSRLERAHRNRGSLVMASAPASAAQIGPDASRA